MNISAVYSLNICRLAMCCNLVETQKGVRKAEMPSDSLASSSPPHSSTIPMHDARLACFEERRASAGGPRCAHSA